MLWGAVASLTVLTAADGKELEGQVFVVTRGAQAIKLPLVQVMALSAADLQTHINEIAEKMDSDCAKAESRTRTALEELQNARRGVSGGIWEMDDDAWKNAAERSHR